MWLQNPIRHVLFKPTPRKVCTYSAYDSSGVAAYTFATATLPPTVYPHLIIGVGGFDATTDFSISGVTVDTVSATELIDSANTGSVVQNALYYFKNPGSGTASIAVTFSEVTNTCAIGVWGLAGIKSTTPTSTISNFQTASARIVLDRRIPERSAIFAVSTVAAGATPTWDGLVQDENPGDGFNGETSLASFIAPNYHRLYPMGCDWTNANDAIGVAAVFS